MNRWNLKLRSETYGDGSSTGHETLTPNDAVRVLEELLPAKNHSHMLGLKLGLPLHDIEGIQSNYHDPRDRLLKVITEFLRQEQTGPTWRVIVDALRSPVVNLPALAKRVEAAHFPDAIPTRDAVPETTTAAESVASTTTDTSGDVVKSKTPSQLSSGEKSTGVMMESERTSMAQQHWVPKCWSAWRASVEQTKNVKREIKSFHQRLMSIKMLTIDHLEKCKIAVKKVVFLLKSMLAADEHTVFLEEKHKSLHESADHWELFGLLSPYCNYLSPDLLDQLIEQLTQLIKELTLEENSFETVSKRMKTYKTDLQKFRQRTTLQLFCDANTSAEDYPPPGFTKIVTEHEWPAKVTLEYVERFRKRYVHAYNLRKCAMMLNNIGTGSFTVTWFVPVTVIDILREKRAVKVYKEFKVSRLKIYVQATAVCVYQTPVQRKTPYRPPFTDMCTSSSAEPQSGGSDKQPQAEEDYPFVEQPSDDFFCPVTKGLLLQPHLTSCCGKHLSQEAATRIQGEGGGCPLCKMNDWTTMLSKHFQRQVNELRVFCRHEDKGCGWQGELSDLERHVQSCPMRDQPQFHPEEYDQGEKSRSQSVSHSATPSPHSKFTYRHLQNIQSYHHKNTAPCKLYRGSATTDHQFAYFAPSDSNSVYSYRWSREKWEELPPCPYRNSGLVIINGELTAVGGWDGYCYTNKLFTLKEQGWVEKYPAMQSVRSSIAAVNTSDGEFIIVIGGFRGVWTTTVELFPVRSKKWHTTPSLSLPQSLSRPSATICGNQLNVIGDDGGYSCSLEDLLYTDEAAPHTVSWVALPPLPVTHSTAVTLCGQLVIIGGWRDRTPLNFIHQLSECTWTEIGSISCERGLCLVVNPSPDEIMVVGGVGEGYRTQDTVEEHTFCEEKSDKKNIHSVKNTSGYD